MAKNNDSDRSSIKDPEQYEALRDEGMQEPPIGCKRVVFESQNPTIQGAWRSVRAIPDRAMQHRSVGFLGRTALRTGLCARLGGVIRR
ncbi:hypothetical protein T35B1_02379 [Salinisphaera shabanensis T35B1]|uniref:DUF7218 family protein n=1 Tax=Salinisphaera shabanensis TaxID=180542 RepID=UPI003341C581